MSANPERKTAEEWAPAFSRLLEAAAAGIPDSHPDKPGIRRAAEIIRAYGPRIEEEL